MTRANAFVRIMGANSPSLLALAQVFVAIMGLASAPIIARSIGPTGRGFTTAAMAAFYLVPILLGLGLPLHVRRRVAVSSEVGVLRTARLVCVGAFVPSALLAFILVNTVHRDIPGAAAIVTLVGLCLSPLAISTLCDASVLIAQGRFRAVFLVRVLQPLANLSVLVVLWATHSATTATVLLANVASMVVAFVVSLIVVKVPFLGEIEGIVETLKNSVRYAGSSIAEAASNRLDQLVMLPLVGAYGAGLYSVGVTISSMPIALAHSLGASFYTQVARTEGDERRALEAQGIRSIFIVAVTVAAGLSLATPILIPLLFGGGFVPAIPVVWVCLLGSIGALVAYVASIFLAAEGRGLQMTAAQIIGLGAGMLMLLLLGPTFVAIGAAWASAIGSWVLAGLLMSFLRLPVRLLLISRADGRATLRALLRQAQP